MCLIGLQKGVCLIGATKGGVFDRATKGGVFDRATKLSECPSNAFRRGRACVACIREKDEASVYLQKLKTIRNFCASWVEKA